MQRPCYWTCDMLREIIDEAIVNWANGEMTTEKIIDKAEADIKAMLLSEDEIDVVINNYTTKHCGPYEEVFDLDFHDIAKAIHQAQMKKIGGQDDGIKAYTK